ncbi:Holliday junction branch migration protein RuvA [Candidatus Gracilibacteria bacterium]|nr:Holliday junction branch migration protein RuvA [Candidatus Gracilibacteria bacterium]
MIGFLQGTVLEIFPKKILVLTPSGVGYEVYPSMNLLGNCQQEKPFSAYIFTVVKETELSLYGFENLDEKALFEKVLSISGIGPKMALQIVSGSVENFLSAVENGDEAIICKIPGIGKKMAQKIIVELQGKIDLSSNPSGKGVQRSASWDEATDALNNLGYDRNTIEKVLSSAPKNAGTEDLVKYFLSSGS